MKFPRTYSFLNILYFLAVNLFLKVYSQNLASSFSSTVSTNISYREILNSTENLSLEWSIDTTSRTITFLIDTREGRYLALGLTRRGQLENFDLVVIGNDGVVYDMYGVNNETISQDVSQDWQLISANSTNGIRSVRIQRNLDTCDDQDMAIRGELIHLVWDFGASQNTPSQIQPKGTRPIYFMDPIILPTTSNFTIQQQPVNSWRLTRRYRLPPRHTSYWCSIHKMNPSLNTRNHIIGFETYFENEVARRHVHHQLVYRCSLPPGVDPASIFENFVNHPGEECYINENPQLPTAFCREMVYIWAVGGEPVWLPENVGIPIGDTTNEYFMFESHYDNPEERSDLEIVNGVDILYSSQIRPNDGSIVFVGQGILGNWVMPPNTPEFSVVGHCSKECTTQMMQVPTTIVGVALHAHTSGRRMRLRHFRGNTELAWIQNDDDYDFEYQQIRFLQNPITLLPGDHLTMECTYGNTDKNGSATVSGFSTRDEMCIAFLVVDKKLPFLFCSSEYPTDRTMARFGIQNMTWQLNSAEKFVNSANDPSIVGLTLSEVVERQEWTREQTAELEREQRFSDHRESCPNTRIFGATLYYLQELETASGGLISLQQTLASQVQPTTATVETPMSLPLPVTYPSVISTYTPPACPAASEMRLPLIMESGTAGISLENVTNQENIVTSLATPIFSAQRPRWGNQSNRLAMSRNI